MSGVQRTLKFVKYLPEFGWQPVVLTVRPRGSYGYDPGLLEEIPRTEIHRTFSLDPLFLSPSRQRPAAAARRGWVSAVNRLFVPDNKVGWIPFAVRRGLDLCRSAAIDAVYSTAPPFSSHLAALRLKAVSGKPLLCDFRDDWTGNPLAAYASRWHQRLDLALEKKVLAGADRVSAINREILDALQERHPQAASGKLCLLPQGFDPADFSQKKAPDNPEFMIVYSGTFVEKRTPEPLLRALAEIRERRAEIFGTIKVALAGTWRRGDREMVESFGMGPRVEFRGFLPHRASVALLQQASLLWLVIHPSEGRTVATGKIYEYLGAGKPILASVPAKGAAAGLLEETGAGRAFSPDDHRSLAEAIIGEWEKWKSGCRAPQPDLERYSRRNIAGRLAGELDQLCP
jgi:glycosyltransferase involved in cell wall biosynthesis